MSSTSIQSMNNQNLMSINDKMFDNIDLISDIDQAVTIEELKGVFKYCFRYVILSSPVNYLIVNSNSYISTLKNLI